MAELGKGGGKGRLGRVSKDTEDTGLDRTSGSTGLARTSRETGDSELDGISGDRKHMKITSSELSEDQAQLSICTNLSYYC